MQKSVFVAPDMGKKHLVRLELGLRQLFARQPPGPLDSLYVFPLPNEYVEDISAYGSNNVVTALQPAGLKIIL